jgi:hypothetical protein
LSREFVDGAGSGGLAPVVNKFDPNSGTSGRMYTIYNDNGGVHQQYGGRRLSGATSSATGTKKLSSSPMIIPSCAFMCRNSLRQTGFIA